VAPPVNSPRISLRARALRLGVRGLVGLGVLIVARLLAFFAFRDDARALLDDRREGDLVARRDYLASRLDSTATATVPDDPLFSGEWVLVTLSMAAMATTNIAFAYPDQLEDGRRIVNRCAELALAESARAFDTKRWGEDPLTTLAGSGSHIGYLGHLALILEAKRLLGGGTDPHEGPVLDALTRRYDGAPFPYLETYPGERYTADNVVVLAALGMSDLGRTPKHAALLARFIAYTKAHLLDPKSQLVVFGVTDAGEAKGTARGSGVGWNSLYLPFIDELFAKAQATLLRDRFGKSTGPGSLAVCEYDGCEPGKGDVDSGPVLLGASPSGTGFAIAAARRLGDEEWLSGLLSTAEWMGFSVQWSGKRRYLLAPLVGDAIVLAAKTSRAWDARYGK
jgi:hypothetical protein